jgi:hypothetical protein
MITHAGFFSKHLIASTPYRSNLKLIVSRRFKMKR